MMDAHGVAAIPVHEVGSYTEAEGLFAERAKDSPSQTSGQLADSRPLMGSSVANLDVSLFREETESSQGEKLPPGGLTAALILTGAFFLWSNGLQTSSPVFFVSLGLIGWGLAIIVWAVLTTDGLREALYYLATIDEHQGDGGSSESENEKTPPTPKNLRDELYFDRANQQCEWCEERVDQPEVHHIIPRSEGGPNNPSNLIVLCPNHHRKADAGVISQSKLKNKVRRLEK